MKQHFLTKFMMYFMVLLLLPFGVFSQMEYSLDDLPNAPLMGPLVPIFGSAEDEFGFTGGSLGPSPTLAGFCFDSDVLFPGPALSMTFPPPPFYVDAISANHFPQFQPPPGNVLYFSVDRASAALPGMAADIFGSVLNGMNFPVWLGIQFGLVPGDNIDGYNEFAFPMNNSDLFFCLHPASGCLLMLCPSDIYTCPPGGLMWPAPIFATAAQMGLVGGPSVAGAVLDSIDSLVVWDRGAPGICDPGWDIALFTLSPSSITLLNNPMWDGATVFWTTFQNGFAPFAMTAQLGLAPGDNIDALDYR